MTTWIVENIELTEHKAILMGIFETFTIVVMIPLVMVHGYLMKYIDFQYYFGYFAILHIISLFLLFFTQQQYPVKNQL